MMTNNTETTPYVRYIESASNSTRYANFTLINTRDLCFTSTFISMLCAEMKAGSPGVQEKHLKYQDGVHPQFQEMFAFNCDVEIKPYIYDEIYSFVEDTLMYHLNDLQTNKKIVIDIVDKKMVIKFERSKIEETYLNLEEISCTNSFEIFSRYGQKIYQAYMNFFEKGKCDVWCETIVNQALQMIKTFRQKDLKTKAIHIFPEFGSGKKEMIRDYLTYSPNGNNFEYFFPTLEKCSKDRANIESKIIIFLE